MTRRRLHSTWLEHWPLSRIYPAIGCLLALGAPLGMLVLRAVQARGGLGIDWLGGELARDNLGYLYLLCSSMLVFASCGFVLGKKEERTRALMMTDPLTGLYNRRYLQLRLEAETARTTRYGGALSMMIIDVDRLKSINDRLGHETGDRALVLVAAAIRFSLRASDVAARYGGDEFAVLCPSTSAEEARVLSERIRSRLYTLVEETLVTVSIGIADLRAPQATGAEQLFPAADRALYQAKAAGRNCVRVASAVEAAPAHNIPGGARDLAR
jgi:diguanylate cyclase (GGDEF)-like protein